ncbi:MAE_28990/MAE_18760 family HEPN-like nuclease [Pseudomonas sp. O230]|uniref:MAE_28990/MAE_18760 family HEPN-like nuclease n=1 Tax=Pseudomonas sp. O230 TaxID=3159450 RepID=UPI00387B72EF
MNTRLSEARELLKSIKQEEPEDGVPNLPTSLSLTLRGLIYVSIYGAMEYTITQGTQAFINNLCSLNVSTKHLEQALYSIALDSQLTSARDTSEKKKWEARRAIFTGVGSDLTCSIPDTVFGSYLHNVYPKTVLEIFLCLGITKPATAEESEVGYFKEITEKRNAVAHGREAAGDAGKGMTIRDIEIRLSATYSICSYFLDTVEEHASKLKFVRPRYRAAYRQNTAN